MSGGVPKPIIAPFFADVDTRVGNIVSYGNDNFAADRKVFGVNWINVGYYAGHTDKLNSFQLVLIDRSETGEGNFDIEFNYNKATWETGDASGGHSGMGGYPVHVGYSNGTGTQGSFFEFAGSGSSGALLDGGGNSLTANKRNSTRNGRYRFQVRGGIVDGIGRMKAPQDQTVTPFAPKTVVAAVTETLPAQVEEITGGWAQGPGLCSEDAADDTPVPSQVTYGWTSSGGSFADATKPKTTWKAPSEPGEYTLTCTIHDATGGTGNTITLVREVKVQVALPKIKFGGQLVSNDSLLRACAGGVDDHAATDAQYRAHTRQVDLTLTSGDKPLPNASIKIQFTGNKGHDYGDGREKKMARLLKVDDGSGTTSPGSTSPGEDGAAMGATDEAVAAAGPWKETLDVTTDANGKVSVWVLSSDVICQPRLVVKWKNGDGEMVEVGKLECDFAKAETLRRFYSKTEPDGDSGWIFDFPHLRTKDRITPAKVYLKFKIDPSKDDDYIDQSGKGNWCFVSQHELEFYVDSVTLYSESSSGDYVNVTGSQSDLFPYAFIKESRETVATPGQTLIRRVTNESGSTPQAYLQGGEEIDKVHDIWVSERDFSQWSE